MPEPITMAVVAIAAPVLRSMADLTRALKEPLGKRKLEELRLELGNSLDGLREVVEAYEGALGKLEKENQSLSTQVDRQAVELGELRQAKAQRDAREAQILAYLHFRQLPFWKRWFAEQKPALPTPLSPLTPR